MNSERFYIFVDTCSLLESCWNFSEKGPSEEIFEYSKSKDNAFWNSELMALISSGDIIIPKRNYDELLKHSNNSSRPNLAGRAKFVLRRISEINKTGELIQIVGDKNDPFADAILLSVALKFKTQKNMLFITQDRNLAADLEAIRNFASVDNRSGYDIKIRRISENGTLEQHPFLKKKGIQALNQRSVINQSVSRQGLNGGEW
jgi:rRNA-processing protein FCF1